MADIPRNPNRKYSRRRSKRRYHTLVLLGIGLLFIVLTMLVQPFSSVQLWLSDRLFTPEPPSANIVIVGIDDDTLQTYGKWADWSRRLHAQALENLKTARAKVVGFDILFIDSSPYDTVFAAAIEEADNVVLLSVGTRALASAGPVIFNDLLLPASPLLEACRATGHANILPDTDGKVRHLPLVIQDGTGAYYPSFSLSILHTLFAMPVPDEYRRENGNLNLLARDIPVDTRYRLLINYAATAPDWPYLSYGDVISGNFEPSIVKNKIVIVGMTATGELDAWQTPISPAKAPGVYIHAAAMDTILRSRFLVETGNLSALPIMLFILAVICLTVPRLKIKWGGLIVLILFMACIASSFFAFDRGYLVKVLYPLLLIPVAFISSIITTIIIEQADKRFVTNLFGRYVSPQVADNLLNLADSGQLRLGGELREVTILFADIRQYTKLSEQMSPEAIVEMLNIYLSIIIDKVLENGGMVNKFAGDNIMAVWNAPQDEDRHAFLAVKAAWESQQAISERQQQDTTLPRVQFGIGINTGEALAGNVGSTGRTEYTVIGDAVNLASRICSVTPGTDVWLGPETYRLIKECIQAEPLEPQAFKGKSERIIVYRLTRITMKVNDQIRKEL